MAAAGSPTDKTSIAQKAGITIERHMPNILSFYRFSNRTAAQTAPSPQTAQIEQ